MLEGSAEIDLTALGLLSLTLSPGLALHCCIFFPYAIKTVRLKYSFLSCLSSVAFVHFQ